MSKEALEKKYDAIIKSNGDQCDVKKINTQMLDRIIKEEKDNDLLDERAVVDESADEEEECENEDDELEDKE